MGAAIVNDFDVADRTDAFEELLQILLGYVIGKISNVNSARFHTLRISTTGTVGVPGSAFLPRRPISLRTLFAGLPNFTFT